MRHHPALSVKYLLPQFTRGTGVELGAFIDQGTTPLYPHFGKVSAFGSLPPDAGTQDFVLVCNAPGAEWFEPTDYASLVKDGGYLLHAMGEELVVSQREGDAWHLVDLAIPGPSVCVVRYGGFGDMIQASTVFPQLKAQGFKVWVMTTPAGRDIIAHDPYVEGVILQDTDQVPNEELSAFWEVQARRFDRFVNLSESVEGTLLAYAGRANHGWPDEVRRRRLGSVNYFEWVCELAGVEFAPDAAFFATQEERDAVQRFLTRTRLKDAGLEGVSGPVNAPARFTVLWTLAGSSVHKTYPHQDEVIGAILRSMPEASVILVGDELCQILEAGWENTPRVHCLSGRIGIRETLALAQACNCVVGPETGVLNAVGHELGVAKVVILSHSSEQNLTANWVQAEAITPPTSCYPCHRLHHDRRYCREHQPTGCAQCAWDVDPFRVFAAIGRAYGAWKNARDLGGSA